MRTRGFTTLGQSSNCLMHTLRWKPTLRSESEIFANQIAAENSTNSQRLKESTVPNTCHSKQCYWHLHCPTNTPKICHLPKKQKICHQIIPTPTPPPPAPVGAAVRPAAGPLNKHPMEPDQYLTAPHQHATAPNQHYGSQLAGRSPDHPAKARCEWTPRCIKDRKIASEDGIEFCCDADLWRLWLADPSLYTGKRRFVYKIVELPHHGMVFGLQWRMQKKRCTV